MIDICLVNWQTEFNYEELQTQFQQTAVFNNGKLKKINHPLREPPTGLMILAAILENAGYSVDLIDCMILEDPESFFQENANKYRMFGFSSLTNTFPETIQLVKKIHTFNPRAYFIMGGPHVSFMYEQELTNHLELDIIFIGEAETTLLWFMNLVLEIPFIDMLYNGDTKQIVGTYNYLGKVTNLLENYRKNHPIPAGIAYRKDGNSDSSSFQKIHYTGFPPSENLSIHPLPARHLIERIYQVADIIVNRGCPNQCSFCSRTKLFPETRIRPLDLVLQELDYILSCGNYKFVNFYDNINVNHKYFNAFLDALIERNMPLPWGAELRADVITLEEANKLKQANCQLVATGIESASKEVLKMNFKFQNPQKVAEGFNRLKKAGIAIQAYFIIGLPGDTSDTFEETIQFAEKLPWESTKDRMNFFLLTPYPGSDIALNPQKYKVSFLPANYKDFNCHEILVETETLKKQDIELMLQKARALKKRLNIY